MLYFRTNFACYSGLITSIIRFVVFFNVNPSPDHTRVAVDLLIWVQLEPGCYLIAACLPVCRPLLERVANLPMMQRLKETIRSSLPSSWTTEREANSDIQLQPRKTSATVYPESVGLPEFYGQRRVERGNESQSTKVARSFEHDFEV